jgi:hypothetical protein
VCEQALKILESYRRSEDSLRENPNFRKDIESLKSDVHFIIGKVHHVKRNFQAAQESYLKAVKLNDKNYAA